MINAGILILIAIVIKVKTFIYALSLQTWNGQDGINGQIVGKLKTHSPFTIQNLNAQEKDREYATSREKTTMEKESKAAKSNPISNCGNTHTLKVTRFAKVTSKVTH